MTKDSKTFWDKIQEQLNELSKRVQAYISERREAREQLIKRKREVKERVKQRIKQNERGHDFPETVKFEVVRLVPKGIKVLRDEPGLFQLRFFANRLVGFKAMLLGLFVVLFIAMAVGFWLEPYNPVPSIIFYCIVFITIYVSMVRARVVVTITEDWLQFGGRYYEMANVTRITLGGNMDQRATPSEMPGLYRVKYGPWGEKTIYKSSSAIVNSYVLYMNRIIDEIRSDDQHASETGQREQKF